MKGFFKRLWQAFFPPKRELKHLRYDAKDKVDITVKGINGEEIIIKDALLSEKANAARKKLLQTELHEGDTYNLGPEATVTVGPPGKAGKAWIQARVKANEEKRRKKFEKWWAEKRAYTTKVMMMSEQELKDAGIWDEVQKFLDENEHFMKMAESMGLVDRKIDSPVTTQYVEPPPSGKAEERIGEAFSKIAEQSPVFEKEAVAVGAEEFVSTATPEQRAEWVERYKAEQQWRPGDDGGPQT